MFRIPSKADVPVTSMSRKDAIFSQVHAETSLMCVLTFNDHGYEFTLKLKNYENLSSFGIVGVKGVVANYPFICAIP